MCDLVQAHLSSVPQGFGPSGIGENEGEGQLTKSRAVM
jgi:hypothetical protein